MSKPHKKLVAWQKSMDLVEKIYELSKRFPRDEVYGLTSQVTYSCGLRAFEYSRRGRRSIFRAV